MDELPGQPQRVGRALRIGRLELSRRAQEEGGERQLGAQGVGRQRRDGHLVARQRAIVEPHRLVASLHVNGLGAVHRAVAPAAVLLPGAAHAALRQGHVPGAHGHEQPVVEALGQIGVDRHVVEAVVAQGEGDVAHRGHHGLVGPGQEHGGAGVQHGGHAQRLELPILGQLIGDDTRIHGKGLLS